VTVICGLSATDRKGSEWRGFGEGPSIKAPVAVSDTTLAIELGHTETRIVRRVGLADLHFHDLRHTGNTLAEVRRKPS
jgi:hypothetical protein